MSYIRGSVDVWCSTGGLVHGLAGLLDLGDKELVESCSLLQSRCCCGVGCRECGNCLLGRFLQVLQLTV